MSQNKGVHPSGWPGNSQPEPIFGGSQSSAAHSFGGPTLGQRGQKPNTKKPCIVSGVWDVATPIKLWVLILHDSCWQWVCGSRPKAPGSRPPSLHKVGIQLGHIVGQEVCLGVWHISISPVFPDTGHLML